MPSLHRLPAWAPWVVALAMTIAVAVWQWTSWAQETEAEAARVRERERARAAAEAREEAAREQTYDALIRATIRQQEVRPATFGSKGVLEKPKPKPKPKLQPQPVKGRFGQRTSTANALNCQRLRRAYPADELAQSPAFQQACQ
jgi:hypothetical protein